MHLLEKVIWNHSEMNGNSVDPREGFKTLTSPIICEEFEPVSPERVDTVPGTV